jgi:hypothetical protein
VNEWEPKIYDALFDNGNATVRFMDTQGTTAYFAYVWEPNDVLYGPLFAKIAPADQKILLDSLHGVQQLIDTFVTAQESRTAGNGTPLVQPAQDKTTPTQKGPSTGKADQLLAEVKRAFPKPQSALTLAGSIKEFIESIEKFIKPLKEDEQKPTKATPLPGKGAAQQPPSLQE